MMITLKTKYAFLLLIPLLVVACSLGASAATEAPTAEPTRVPDTSVPPTQVPTEVPTTAPTYPAQDICDQMAALIEQNLNLPVDIKSDAFNDASGLSGAGCTASASGTGEVVSNWGQTNNNLLEAIKSQGWVQDFNFFGAGAGGSMETYRRDGYVCRYLSDARPADMNLCTQNESLGMCMDRINPAQRLFTVSISCSPDSYVPNQPTNYSPPSSQPIRVQFQPNATSWVTTGDLPPNLMNDFVLRVLAGQQMTVNLTPVPGFTAAMSIRAADGTVLLPEQSGVLNWTGIVPSNQDYLINVRNTSQQAINYTLEVIIPPAPVGAQTPTNSEPVRIQFQPNATSWVTQGDLNAYGMIRFVLRAMKDQQMTVNLGTNPASSAILIIWGADGTVLISDHADAMNWTGKLPSTQDYYVDVRAGDRQVNNYTLEVIIP